MRDTNFRAPLSLAVAENATTPTGLVGSEIWSTTAAKKLIWNGTAWVASGGGGGSPTGAAGGVLSGTYPNPGFAVDMATQAELDAVAAAKANTAHTHALADVSGLNTALAGKQGAITVSSTAPSSPTTNQLWIQI